MTSLLILMGIVALLAVFDIGKMRKEQQKREIAAYVVLMAVFLAFSAYFFTSEKPQYVVNSLEFLLNMNKAK